MPLDLRSKVRSAGIRMILYGFVGLIVGALAAAIGAVTGFVLCIAIPILLASPFAMLWGFLELVYPDIRFGHLGSGPQRDAAIQHVEGEARAQGTMYQKTQRGEIWLTPTWVVVLADDEVVVTQRRDVLCIYPELSRGRRSTSASIKLRTRAKDYKVGIEEVEKEWFMRTLASAAPWAFLGYDPRTATMPVGHLAYEVDQRMRADSYRLPPGSGG